MKEDIFDEPIYWKGYKVSYCDQCEVYSIKCKDEKCLGSSCNGGGCDKCVNDFIEFCKLKISPLSFLSIEEIKTYHKINYLKDYIKECFKLGVDPIDWKKIEENGGFCKRARDIFVEELK